MLESIKEKVYQANIELVRNGLVIHTWGNVSGKDPKTGYIVIKPSGVAYDSMSPGDMVILDHTGKIIEGRFKPSTDAPTHLSLYNRFSELGGIVHTHSAYATAWAQSGRAIPPFGTTHADHFYGEVPVTRLMDKQEIDNNYEENTGKIIIEKFQDINPLHVPSVLVNGHGPFCWGRSAEEAVYNAVALEEVARMAFYTVLLGKNTPVGNDLLEKHFSRKHGAKAYYGQNNSNK